MTPLLCALCKGNTIIAKSLIDSGANISATDSEMRSSLHWVVLSDNLSAFTALMGDETKVCSHKSSTNLIQEFTLPTKSHHSHT